MKRFHKTTVVLSLMILLAWATSSHAIDPKVEELSQKKPPQMKTPDINTVTLKNGIKVYYLQDKELPIFKLNAYFVLGTRNSKADDLGVYTLFTSSWDAGGSTTQAPETIEDQLEFISATIDGSMTPVFTVMSMGSLMKDHQDVIKTFTDLVKNPKFDPERLEIIKKNTIDGIKQRNDTPMSIAVREFQQTLYGESSPYAWLPSEKDISSVKREDLISFHQNYIGPDRMMIGASSPLSFSEFLKLVSEHFESWDKTTKVPHEPNAVKKEWQPSVEFIHKEGNQSSLVLGHFGEKRFNKDKYKLILADEVLGGSTFGSKLGNRLRTDLGLVYSIGSNFDFSMDYGQFRIYTQTKSETTVKAIQEISKILANMVNEKNILADELELARERIINRLIFAYDDRFQMVTRRIEFDYYGFPPDYIEVYQQKIESVTLDEIKEVLATYFFPDRLKIMIVGDKDKITNLNELGSWSKRPLDLK